MVLMREQSVPVGQQRSVVFEARVMQDVLLGQQKLSGRPVEEQDLKDDGQDEEDCRGARAARRVLGCADVAVVMRSETVVAMMARWLSCFLIAVEIVCGFSNM